MAENLVDDPIATEAVRAAAHFGDYNPNAVFIIVTPPRPVATGQPAYCGYHSQTTSINGIGNPYRIQYAFIPWQNTDWPGIGQGCGLHSVNAKSNSFGNGIFDSWSIVVGHEYEEAVTDPDNFFAVQDGVERRADLENSDKCAWTKLKNAKLGSHLFAVQPNWSNGDFDAGGDGCPTPVLDRAGSHEGRDASGPCSFMMGTCPLQTAAPLPRAPRGGPALPDAQSVGCGLGGLLETLGFEALATTSAGFAWSLGKLDQKVTRDELVAHVAALTAVTSVPLNVDSERLYPDEPGGVAETVRLLGEAGASGCSIEDYDPVAGEIDDIGTAAARVLEAAGAAHEHEIVLTGRAENHIRGVENLDDTIERLVAYRDAGADCLYAPGLTNLEQIRLVVDEVGAPVNVLALPAGPPVGELEAVGVRRVSTGGLLASVAYGAAVAGARELHDAGTSKYGAGSVPATCSRGRSGSRRQYGSSFFCHRTRDSPDQALDQRCDTPGQQDHHRDQDGAEDHVGGRLRDVLRVHREELDQGGAEGEAPQRAEARRRQRRRRGRSRA